MEALIGLIVIVFVIKAICGKRKEREMPMINTLDMTGSAPNSTLNTLWDNNCKETEHEETLIKTLEERRKNDTRTISPRGSYYVRSWPACPYAENQFSNPVKPKLRRIKRNNISNEYSCSGNYLKLKSRKGGRSDINKENKLNIKEY